MLGKDKWTWTVEDGEDRHTVLLDNSEGKRNVYVDDVLIGQVSNKDYIRSYEYNFKVGSVSCVIFVPAFKNGRTAPYFIVNGYYTDRKDYAGNIMEYTHVPEKDVFGRVLLGISKLNILILLCTMLYSFFFIPSLFHFDRLFLVVLLCGSVYMMCTFCNKLYKWPIAPKVIITNRIAVHRWIVKAYIVFFFLFAECCVAILYHGVFYQLFEKL